MRKSDRGLRAVLAAFADEGLQLDHISQGGRHAKLHLANGTVVVLSRGTRRDVNFLKIARDQARRIARQVGAEKR